MMRYRALPLVLFIAVVILLLVGPFRPFSFQKDGLEISAEAARRRRHALILDVRTPKEREAFGFFPESIPVDPSRVTDEVPFLLGQKPGSDQPPRPTPILVYSNAGDGRAQQVAERLFSIGFTGVRYLKDSYLDMLPPGPLHSTNAAMA
jgi:rhodanese-related sulfurtransferase